MAGAVDWTNRICGICDLSQDFRVLHCGHPICVDCATSIYLMNRTILCPWDRKEDKRMPHTLPTPEQFNGEIFFTVAADIAEPMLEQPAEQRNGSHFNAPVENGVGKDIEWLLQDLVHHRKRTVKHLRDAADILSKHEYNCSISKIAGSTAGVSEFCHYLIITWPEVCLANMFEGRCAEI